MIETHFRFQTTPLQRISLESGDVLHALRQSDASFQGFGEAYFSIVHHRAIKGWKCHTRMLMNLIVPAGDVKFVFYNDLDKSFTELTIGDSNYQRLTVCPNVWFAFQGLSSSSSIILNIADIPHDPNESLKRNLAYFNYDW